MKIDLDHELQKLGREILAEFEPMTAEEVTGPCARSRPYLRPVTEVRPLKTTSPNRRSIGRRATLVGAAAAVTLLAAGLVVADREGDRRDPGAAGSPDPTAFETTPTTMTPPTTLDSATVVDTVWPVLPSSELAWPPRLVIDEINVSGASGGPVVITNIIERGVAGVERGLVEYAFAGGNITLTYFDDEADADLMNPASTEAATATVLGIDSVVNGSTLDEGKTGTLPTDSVDPADFEMFSVTIRFEGHLIHIWSGEDMSLDAFMNALANLHPVEAESWLTRLPSDAITPDERASVVDNALDAVPLPEGFDIEGLRTSPAVADLASVTRDAGFEVACAWIGQWVDAMNQGDTAAADATAANLADVRSWPAFIASDDLMFIRVAEGLADGTLVVDDFDITPDNAGSLMECPGYPPFGNG